MENTDPSSAGWPAWQISLRSGGNHQRLVIARLECALPGPRGWKRLQMAFFGRTPSLFKWASSLWKFKSRLWDEIDLPPDVGRQLEKNGKR